MHKQNSTQTKKTADALPPKYQPTRSIILALENAEDDELPTTVSAALVSADATVRSLHDLLAEGDNDPSTADQERSQFTDSESTRERHEIGQREGVESMTFGILQNSYLVEKFLEELERVGQFGGGERRSTSSTTDSDNDPGVVHALRREIQFLASELSEVHRSNSLLHMEMHRLTGGEHHHHHQQQHDHQQTKTRSNSAHAGDGIEHEGGGGGGGGSGGGKGGNDNDNHSNKMRQRPRDIRRRSSIGSTRNLLADGVLHKAASVGSLVELRAAPLVNEKSIGSQSRMTREEGRLAHELEEMKRETTRRMEKNKHEVVRANMLIEAADLERTHAERNLKDSESRVRHAEDADLDEVLRSLQVELAGWRSKAQGAINQLERERTKRLVGSVRVMETQTFWESDGGGKEVGCQTNHSGSVSSSGGGGSGSGGGGGDESDEEEEEEEKETITKKTKGRRRPQGPKPKMSGAQWVKAAQYWSDRDGSDGLLYFARTFKMKDIQIHTLPRTMTLVRSIMEDKISGDEQERDEPLQDYVVRCLFVIVCCLVVVFKLHVGSHSICCVLDLLFSFASHSLTL